MMNWDDSEDPDPLSYVNLVLIVLIAALVYMLFRAWIVTH